MFLLSFYCREDRQPTTGAPYFSQALDASFTVVLPINAVSALGMAPGFSSIGVRSYQ